jgi:formylglycine-generating enzyme required for sulfatase activity
MTLGQPGTVALLCDIPGGHFVMGSDSHYPEEAPVRRAEVSDFTIDAATVTNDEFARFVRATGYVTSSERALDRALHPGMPDEFYLPGSLVFQMTSEAVQLHDPGQWWSFVPGASWRHPEGPETTVTERGLHPVVHVSCKDAVSYANWAGKKLPTEAQWEYAAQRARGPESDPNLNIWRGQFPYQNARRSSPPFTEPSVSGARGDRGPFHMLGNVWEWTCDPYESLTKTQNSCCKPESGTSVVINRVLKGGSYLCAESYCRRYRPAARLAYAEDASAGHIGFRCVSA